ncbi:rCG45805 [Rattus norvegicus]|uniref:RCG45805 n=1 Tax=Rattus norvegicus TaxID=10116 RepID=A6JU36_RAT|nr:rCG45805 [Rattus norvegicus]
MSFIGVTYRNMGEGLLTGAEMIHRQPCPQTPPPAWVKAHKIGILELAWPTVRQVRESPFPGPQLFFSKSFLCSSALLRPET